MAKSSRKTIGVRHHKAKERFLQIRKLVNYKFQDTDYAARKIKEDYERLWPLIHQPYTAYKTKSAQNRKIAAQGVGLTGREKRIKVIPVPSAGVENVKIKVTRGKLEIVSDFVRTEIITFDKYMLARSGPEYVNSLVSGFDRKKTRFKIQTGNYEIAVGYHADHIAGAVERLKTQYAVGQRDQYGVKIKRKQSWKAWLNGLAVMEGQNQKQVKDVIARQKKEKEASYKANKKRKVRSRNK